MCIISGQDNFLPVANHDYLDDVGRNEVCEILILVREVCPTTLAKSTLAS